MALRDLAADLPALVRRARNRDLRSLWFAALSFGGIYRRLVLLERSLHADPTIQIPAEVRVAPLEDDHVSAYLALRPDQDDRTVRSRLARGHRCFAVWHQERIVHVAWAATGQAPVDYLSWDFTLHPGEVFVFDAYTLPTFRGRGASPARALVLGQYFRSRGYQRLLTAVHPENTVGFRPLEKLGTTPVGMIGYVGIGRWRRHFRRERR